MKTLKLFGLLTLAALFFAPSAQADDFNAGPIWNHADAQNKCPGVCRLAGGGRSWSGHWRTTVPGRMSVCGCVLPAPPAAIRPGKDFPAGPIWNHADAQNKCPRVCAAAAGRRWSGHWRTTIQGRMSVCNCIRAVVVPPPPVVRPAIDINAGPIWNQADAQVKCPHTCVTNHRTWTGHWRTTVPGRMSVCNCR